MVYFKNELCLIFYNDILKIIFYVYVFNNLKIDILKYEYIIHIF